MKNWSSRLDDKQYYENLLIKRKPDQEMQYNFNCSLSSKSEKRHDSDSQNEQIQDQDEIQLKDDQIKKEMKEALGVESDSDLSLDREDDEIANQLKAINLQADQFKNAQTVYRDSTGKQVTLEELQMNTLEMKKIQLIQKNKEVMKEWAFGYKQKLEKEKKNKELQKVTQEGMSKVDMSEKNKFNDPMIRLIEQDQILEINDLSTKLRCRFKGMPNRYSILPGWRWDGVERGNGYEQKLFNKLTTKKIKTQQAYVENTKEM